MAAYMHGNLAVEDRRPKREVITETTRVVYRRPVISVQEKLLYLTAVVLCVVAAGMVIWKHVQIYEMNTKIQKMEREIRALEVVNHNLQLEIHIMQDPKKLLEQAREMGYVFNRSEQLVLTPQQPSIGWESTGSTTRIR